MSETSVVLALSESLHILSVDGIKLVADEMGPSALSGVLLSVEEPLGDVVLVGASNDVTNAVDLLLGDLSRSLVDVDLGDLHSKDGESSSNTADLSKTERSLLFTVDVCVLHSENVSELVGVLQYQ